MHRLEDFDLFVYDFDGVLTDNRVLVLEDGTEGVFCNRGDGLAISYFKKQDKKQVILSTETNPVVSSRAKKLNLAVIQGSESKLDALRQIWEESGVKPERTLYIGNDINDLEAMETCGLRVCPQDSCSEIIDLAHVVTKARGGEGVVRELMDIFS
ncbi:HAD hydrolase family protein [bacterium]|jgi:3-deoxy-D-manno-octulosonate 8-phosphate phosphatase (KDO 8-P phosphatase)|nr:HAD hydrolase family protein [bacterium]